MLPTSVAVHGHGCLATPIASCACSPVNDAEGFVRATINRLGLGLSEHDRDDLTCDGVEILYRLAGRFTLQASGYAQPGRFNGFAARWLPGKLLDAWHKANPEHRRVEQPDGSTRWHYYPRPFSTSAMDDERAMRLADDAREHYEHRIIPQRHWLPLPDPKTARSSTASRA